MSMSRSMPVVWRVTLVVSLVGASLLVTGAPAHAACHAFTVSVDPAEPAEGATVTVTIQRDAAANPSSVRVRTVDGTATGDADYTPLDERVEFTTGTEQTREVEILDDSDAEDPETFTIELSEGEGCEVNPNFTYDSAEVTIQDDDPAASPSPSPSPSPAPSPTTTEATDDELPQTGPGAALAFGAIGLLAAAALLWRRPQT